MGGNFANMLTDSFMKEFKNSFFVSALLLLAIGRTFSQTTNRWDDSALGAKLSISLSNSVIDVGSAISLRCLTKNLSTNYVCFIQTDPRGMYEVFLFNASGKSFKINGLEDGGDTSDRAKKIELGESFECVVPIPLDKQIERGRYKILAKQKIFVLKNFDRKNAIHGELVSNLLEVQIK